jgi:hypothetical protein
MKIYFRGGIYITLMKMIIFMRVCFLLSRKTDPLTKSRVSGSENNSPLCRVFFK